MARRRRDAAEVIFIREAALHGDREAVRQATAAGVEPWTLLRFLRDWRTGGNAEVRWLREDREHVRRWRIILEDGSVVTAAGLPPREARRA